MGIFLAGVGLPAAAQSDYPAKPVRMIVGSAPGGGTDLVARALAPKLGNLLGQQVVVDNRPGANQMIGAELTAKSPPDGYTLLMAPAGFTINPSIYKQMAYDPVRDFTPISMVAIAPNVLVIHPALPPRTIKDLIALARARPTELTYGSSGVGSPSHLSGALFELLSKTKLTHVPYKGSGPAMIDLLGGHLQVSFPSLPGAIPFISSKRLVALGVTTRQRSPSLPDVPTIEEAGVPGYEVASWFGVMGPAKLPKDITVKLNTAVIQALQDRDLRQSLARDGSEPLGGTPEQFAARISSEIPKWAKVLAAAGFKPE
jgi:tripartite-type tricarboxylate transporter receptor subunit TctC